MPALVFYIAIVVIPSIQGAAYAFTDWDGVSIVKKFVGLDQFTQIVSDPDALGAVTNTLFFAVSITVLQNVVGLLLALGLNTKIKSRNVLRIIIFAPAVVPSVAIGFLWQNMYGPDGGINALFNSIGLPFLASNWLGDPTLAHWAIVVATMWQFIGYSMVIYLAGLQGVPEEVLEASALDGAGAVRRFWSVVRPLLAPAITINVVLSLISGLKLFDQVLTITAGGPGGATNTISTLIYQDAFSLGRFGYAAALAVVLTIFVAIIAAVQYTLLRRQES